MIPDDDDTADDCNDEDGHNWSACATCAAGCYICLTCGANEVDE